MEAGSIVEALAQPGDLRSLVRRHRRRLRGGALRRRCRLLPELIYPAAPHRVAQTELLRDRPDRSTTRYRQFNGLALVVLGERPTLAFWHSTPPGSLSLLQVSTHSEAVHAGAMVFNAKATEDPVWLWELAFSRQLTSCEDRQLFRAKRTFG